MLQVKLVDKEKIVYEEAEPPELKPGEAIIGVKSVGICGGDMRFYTGKQKVERAMIRGHEFGGVIKKINEDTSPFRVGMKVAVNPVLYCGECYTCQNSRQQVCENIKVMGGAIDGGMQEEIAVPIRNLIHLEDTFDLRYAPLIEPVAFAIHAVGQIKSSTVMIIGLGTIGLLIQQICQLNSNHTITLDIQKESLKISGKLSSDLVLNINEQDKTNAIAKNLSGKKIDYAIDCVCSKDTLKFAVDQLKNGGTVIVVGIPAKDYILPNSIVHREIKVVPKFLFREENFSTAVGYLQEDKIQYRPLLSKVFPLHKAREAFTYKMQNPVIKVVMMNE